MTVLFPKIIKTLAYAGAFIDAGISINENIEKGSSWQKTSSDAFIELVISAGSIYASGKVRIIVGAIAGLLFGILIYIVTDQIEWEGKSMRDHIKDYISDYYGWD